MVQEWKQRVQERKQHVQERKVVCRSGSIVWFRHEWNQRLEAEASRVHVREWSACKCECMNGQLCECRS